MGIVGSIIRSSDDALKPKKKSYWGYKLNIELRDVQKVKTKKFLLPAEKKEIRYELSGKEPVEKVIVLDNSDTKLGRLTTFQMKDILDDMGFNVDVLVSGKHYSDFDAVLNIGGFSLPGWRWFVGQISKIIPTGEKLLLSKLSPGRTRLHVRVFEQNDGSWVLIAHTDINWLSINFSSVYRAHMREGAGDYTMGTRIMFNLLNRFSELLMVNKILGQEEIDTVVRNSLAQPPIE